MPPPEQYGLSQFDIPEETTRKYRQTLAASRERKRLQRKAVPATTAHATDCQEPPTRTFDPDHGAIRPHTVDQLGAIDGAISPEDRGAIRGATSEGPGAISEHSPASQAYGALFAQRRRDLKAIAELGQRWLESLQNDPIPSMSRLAREEGLPSERVRDALEVARLHPEILEDIYAVERTTPLPYLTHLRLVSKLPQDQQLERYQHYLVTVKKPSEKRINLLGDDDANLIGIPRHFARARKLQSLLDSGQYASVKALTDAAGLHNAVVRHLLNVVQLAPDLVAKLDVPPEQLPKDFMAEDLERLARIKRHEDQRIAFDELVKRRQAG